MVNGQPLAADRESRGWRSLVPAARGSDLATSMGSMGTSSVDVAVAQPEAISSKAVRRGASSRCLARYPHVS